MGTPLVMTDVSGAPDLIADGVTGLLVPRGDAAALAQALRTLHGDPDLRGRLASAARAAVERRLTLTQVIPRFADAYRRVAEER
jgi:glycosyltransferase involved in cell wall biosynthesis